MPIQQGLMTQRPLHPSLSSFWLSTDGTRSCSKRRRATVAGSTIVGPEMHDYNFPSRAPIPMSCPHRRKTMPSTDPKHEGNAGRHQKNRDSNGVLLTTNVLPSAGLLHVPANAFHQHQRGNCEGVLSLFVRIPANPPQLCLQPTQRRWGEPGMAARRLRGLHLLSGKLHRRIPLAIRAGVTRRRSPPRAEIF